MSDTADKKQKKLKADPSKAVFLEWDVEEQEFTGWKYNGAGYGEEAQFKPITVTRRVLYSRTATQEMIDRALRWVEEQRPDGRIIIETLPEEPEPQA